MENSKKFILPLPNFLKKPQDGSKLQPHSLTPPSIVQPRHHQQPPPRGSTVPGKYLHQERSGRQSSESVPAPEEKQYCESCDLVIDSVELLRRHRTQHEKCPVDECNYRGHPSVMDKHVETLHLTNVFEKVKKLNTPEEIAAWREERRKRYPTVANVLMQQKARDQRQKRGERIEASRNRFGRPEDRQRVRNGPNKDVPFEKSEVKGKNREPRKSKWQRKKEYAQKKREEHGLTGKQQKDFELGRAIEQQAELKAPEDEESLCDGVRMFRGTKHMVGYKHNKPKIVEKNVLSGLLGMYGSDDEDDSCDESDNEDEKENVERDTEMHNCEEQTTELLEIDNEDEKQNVESDTEIHDCEEQSTKVLETEGKAESDSNEDRQDDPMAIDTVQIDVIAIKESSSYSEKSPANLLEPPEEESSLNRFDNVEANSSDDAPDEAPIVRASDYQPPQPAKKMDQPATSGEHQQPAKVDAKTDRVPASRLRSTVQHRRYGLDYRKARVRQQNTLLEKLLAPDIRHERNVLLQCVRYVCENGFFDIGSSTSKPKDS